MGGRLVSNALFVFLQIFFGLFLLGVAAYALYRAAGWLFDNPRQRAIVTAAVLGSFVLGSAINPSLRVASQLGGILVSGSISGSGSATDLTLRCSSLRRNSASPYGKIDEAEIDDAGTVSKLLSGAEISARDTIGLRGWISISGRLQPAAGVCLVVDGLPDDNANIYYGASRPDVVATMGAPQLATAGFDVRFAVSTLTPGRHRVQLGAFDADRKSLAVLGDSYIIDVAVK
jgi:hypothetical protein